MLIGAKPMSGQEWLHMLAQKMLREATMSRELDGNVVRRRKRPMIIEGVALEVKKIVGWWDGVAVGFEFF